MKAHYPYKNDDELLFFIYDSSNYNTIIMEGYILFMNNNDI